MNEDRVKPQKNNKKRNIFIAILIVLAILTSTVFYLYNQFFSGITTVDMTENEDDLSIKPEAPKNEDIINIALFGIDTRDTDYDGSRTDTIMIITIDNKHDKIKLSSIMRDTYVDIPGKKMDKINHAYAFGGPELSIKTINQNFDMNIKDYITVNFVALEEIIDAIGGVEITLKKEELRMISGSPIAGTQLLTGKQAVDYARIRYVGNADYERTERQRRVMQQIITKLQNKKSIADLMKLMRIVLPYTETSFTQSDLIGLGSQMLAAGKRPVEETRLPVTGFAKGTMIKGVYYLVPKTLEDNVKHLHEFIYEEEIVEDTN